MAVPTLPLETLVGAPTPDEQLRLLKDLKNSVIGNTWKKVEVVEDERLLHFLLSQLDLDATLSEDDDERLHRMEMINETAVILGALGNVGSLTIGPLLLANTPYYLLALIRDLTTTSSPPSHLDRLLPPLLRALRNILISTADLVWGHMWGVGSERKVVGTGLEGMDARESKGEGAAKGKGPVGKKAVGWRWEASRSLGAVFEPANLDTLLSLLYLHPNPQTLLPLYQLLSRLIALPSHREALARWTPPPSAPTGLSSQAGPSSAISRSPSSSPSHTPFILTHLLGTISSSANSSPPVELPMTSMLSSRKPSPRLLEAALDLLAALVHGQASLASTVRNWSFSEEGAVPNAHDPNEGGRPLPAFVGLLVDLLLSGPTPVRIAAASCLTNIIKADKGMRQSERVRSTVLNLQLLDVIVKLFQGEGMEERVKLCFILAALVPDDVHLQKAAEDQGCPAHLIQLMITIDTQETKGEIGEDIASRSKEAILLALSSLAYAHEPTRALVAESNPPFLPHLLAALRHPSYGIRAAACQLARALSRTIAILRTSLVDSGVGEEVIALLRREVDARERRVESRVVEEDSRWDHEEMGQRGWTVEVAATATICNLIADFSPLKARLLSNDGLALLCTLTSSPHDPLALNALWALKNLTFHALEPMKSLVVSTLTWPVLRRILNPPTATPLRQQALEIAQNLLADASAGEIGRTLECLGEGEWVDELGRLAGGLGEEELTVPTLYVLSNLALGNERTRQLLISRLAIIEALSNSISAKPDPPKIPALRCLRHLLESSSKSRRPRQAVLDLLQPYQLKPRLLELAEASPSLDVCQAAVGLLECLERAR